MWTLRLVALCTYLLVLAVVEVVNSAWMRRHRQPCRDEEQEQPWST